MDILTSNITYILQQKGKTLASFLSENGVNKIADLPLKDLQLFCHEEGYELVNLLSYNLSVDKTRLKSIKLLILDVDGVMTDAGMFFAESGDQFKKYNAKDGMAIMALPSIGLEAGIISSGFKLEMVKARAELLKIKRVYVGREPKIDILTAWCDELNIDLSEVCIIGDDINDLGVMRSVGFSVAPSDAVPAVKEQVDLVLQKKGGRGCVREFIDHYLLEQPLMR